MSEQANGPRDPDEQQHAPTFVGGAFGVTSTELEADDEHDPVAAFEEVEDAEDTGPDIIAAGSAPETVQEDVSKAQEGSAPADVEGTSDEPSPGERNDPV